VFARVFLAAAAEARAAELIGWRVAMIADITLLLLLLLLPFPVVIRTSHAALRRHVVVREVSSRDDACPPQYSDDLFGPRSTVRLSVGDGHL